MSIMVSGDEPIETCEMILMLLLLLLLLRSNNTADDSIWMGAGRVLADTTGTSLRNLC
jgi:hypothetical protein